MKTNKLCVNQHDYEHYLIPLPMNALFGKKRKSYLFSELEKRHPCFSDEFCFDSRLAIKKRHLFFDVVVMSKMKLVEYRRKLKKYSSGVCFENLNRKGFSNDKNLFVRICLLILLVAFVFGGSILQRKNAVTNENEVPESPIIIESQNQKDANVNEFCAEFLECVSNNDGKISNFEWKTDGYKESINCEMKNIFPEQFGSIGETSDFSEIKYINDVPNVSFSGEKKLASRNTYLTNKSENFEFYSCIRNCLQKPGVKIISEKRKPYSIYFTFANENDVLSELVNQIKKYDYGISKMIISCANDNTVAAEITFSDFFTSSEGLDLSILEKNISLFFKKNENKNIEQKIESKKENQNYQNLKKIGEVIYENGETISFYKNEKNKMVKIIGKVK